MVGKTAGEVRAARRAGVGQDGNSMLGNEIGGIVGKTTGKSGNNMVVTSGTKVVEAHGVETRGKMIVGMLQTLEKTNSSSNMAGRLGTKHNHSVAECMARRGPGTSWWRVRRDGSAERRPPALSMSVAARPADVTFA